jgi:ubiquitin carboxyl-terminal hydrolase 1
MAYRMSYERSPQYYQSKPRAFFELSSDSSYTYLSYVILGAIVLYQGLRHFDLLPFDSLFEILWNILVYITPASLVMALESRSIDAAAAKDENTVGYSGSRTFAAKSEVMRKMLGMNNSVAWTRRKSAPIHLSKTGTGDGPAGLGNWDHSCYQNSVLQGLASLSSVLPFLEQAMLEDDATRSTSTNKALRELIEDLNSPGNAGRCLWTPPVLKSMNSWQQQDAQEYFSKVLDEVDKEAAKRVQNQTHHAGFRDIQKIASRIAKETVSDAKTEKSPQIPRLDELPEELSSILSSNPLEGLLAQRVGCLQCGYVEGLSLIPFNCLTLPLGRNSNYDIQDCLDNYTTLEEITGVECGKCTLIRQSQLLNHLLERWKAKLSSTPSEENAEISPESHALFASYKERLDSVLDALAKEDFSETTLSKKCQIPSSNRVSTTKTRQAVVARSPKCLVLHINRSIFDEMTGAQSKNIAAVQFPEHLNLSAWCLGSNTSDASIESWNTTPSESMLMRKVHGSSEPGEAGYVLRAVITHIGRHENGHYICYRRSPRSEKSDDGDGEDEEEEEQWWRLSDAEVARVSEKAVLSQSGVFMLFYERGESDGDNQGAGGLEMSVYEDCKGEVDGGEVQLVNDSTAEKLEVVDEKKSKGVKSKGEQLLEPFVVESLTGESSMACSKELSVPSAGKVETENMGDVSHEKVTELSHSVKPITPRMRTSGASNKERKMNNSPGGMAFTSSMVTAN